MAGRPRSRDAFPRTARTVGVLRRNPGFARLFAAQLVSFMGDWFATVALLGLVLEKSGSGESAGLLMVAQLLPHALVAPFAGVLVDRLDRRAVMIAADVARAGLALGFLAARSEDTLWVAYVCLAGISAVTAFFEPASSASLPNLVRREDLASANVLVGSAWGTMLAVGAALGGLVTATLGRDAAFLGDAASFAASAALLLTVRGRFREEEPDRTVRLRIVADIREAASYARHDSRVLTLLFVKGGFGLSGGVWVLLGIFATEVFDRGDAGIGILMSARGFGALVGPFVFRRVFGTQGGRLFRAIAFAFACYGVGYAVFGVSPSILPAALAVFVAHLGGGAQWTLSTYGLQRYTDDRVRGRIFAFDYALVTLTLALSVWLIGRAADAVNPRFVAVGVAVAAVAWSIVWTLATRRVWRKGGPDVPQSPGAVAG